LKLAFLNNQIDGRGTGNAVYNYAHYNEEILGNESKIFTFASGNHDESAVDSYVKRFGNIYTPTPENLKDCDALYHIKSGEKEIFSPEGIPYLVHAVFKSEPHGDRYAAISEWMGIRDSIPFVPHIVKHPPTEGNLRKFIHIPNDATVFGRIGGWDSFDIPWVWDAIKEILDIKSDYWFIFVNTPVPFKHERIISYPATQNPGAKRVFVETCDAMIHARNRGETFGISVGEFSVLGKHIFTYADSYEKAHIYELKGTAKVYKTKEHLLNLFMEYKREPAHPFYDKFTPELVMEQFNDVFLGA
jgi:hypothetical protein